MSNPERLGLTLLLVPILHAATLIACCMVPTSYPGDVDQTRQDGVILFHDGHEELVVRVQPTFPDFDYGPPQLAWILTIPSSPTGYAAIDAEVFTEAQALYQKLERLAEEQKPKAWNPLQFLGNSAPTVAGRAEPGLDITATVRVGPYEITEVRARGEGGAQALNAYLDERGFPAESVEELTYFTARGFSFLCIHVHPPEGHEKLGKDVELPALQVSFATDRPYYPAKYSARQGNFALALNVVSSEPLDRGGLGRAQKKLKTWNRYPNLYTTRPLPDGLRNAAARLPGASSVSRWYVNPCASWGFNPTDPGGTPAIMHWDDDIFFEVGGAADLPPSWYHGDRELGFFESFWRDRPARYGAITALGVGALVMVLWRARRRRPALDAKPADS